MFSIISLVLNYLRWRLRAWCPLCPSLWYTVYKVKKGDPKQYANKFELSRFNAFNGLHVPCRQKKLMISGVFPSWLIYCSTKVVYELYILFSEYSMLVNYCSLLHSVFAISLRQYSKHWIRLALMSWTCQITTVIIWSTLCIAFKWCSVAEVALV